MSNSNVLKIDRWAGPDLSESLDVQLADISEIIAKRAISEYRDNLLSKASEINCRLDQADRRALGVLVEKTVERDANDIVAEALVEFVETVFKLMPHARWRG